MMISPSQFSGILNIAVYLASNRLRFLNKDHKFCKSAGENSDVFLCNETG